MFPAYTPLLRVSPQSQSGYNIGNVKHLRSFTGLALKDASELLKFGGTVALPDAKGFAEIVAFHHRIGANIFAAGEFVGAKPVSGPESTTADWRSAERQH